MHSTLVMKSSGLLVTVQGCRCRMVAPRRSCILIGEISAPSISTIISSKDTRKSTIPILPSSSFRVGRTNGTVTCVSRYFSSSSSSPSASPIYTFAISRDVPQSFPNALTKFADNDSTDASSSSSTTTSPIDMDLAREQHHIYLSTLRKYVPTLCLPAIDELADSVFVEDTVVAVGGKSKSVVITNPGHPSRRPEVDTIRHVLTHQLGMVSVTDMREFGQDGKEEVLCDGGDVLNTGRHVFVGLSERTNHHAVSVLERGFGGSLEVIPVPFEGEALHLKSIVTHVDGYTLLAPEGGLGDAVLAAMGAVDRGYTVVRLPNMLACNVISVNGCIIAQNDGCAQSRSILQKVAKERNLQIEFISLSEYAKCDGALTCCSVLLQL